MTFWNKLPSPIRSYLVSMTLTVQSVLATMVTVGYGLGLCGSLEATIHYIISNAWAGLMAAVLGIGPYYRAHKATVANVEAGLPGSSSAPSSIVATPKPVVYTVNTLTTPVPVSVSQITQSPIGNTPSMNATLSEILVVLNLFFPNNTTVKDVEAVLSGIETGQPFSLPSVSLGGKLWTITASPAAPAA